MAQSPIAQAIKNICEEKNIPLEMVVSTVEAALAAAFRKDFGEPNQNVKVDFEMETGDFTPYDVKTVVEDRDLEQEIEDFTKRAEMRAAMIGKGEEPPEEDENIIKRFNPKTEILLRYALLIKPDSKLGDIIRTDLEVPEAFGRMAAQTAKQVIIQKLREAERITIHDEFKDREGEIINGVIQRREGRVVLVDLGRTIGVLPQDNQVSADDYQSGQRMKFFIEKVEMGTKGPEVILSRVHPQMVRNLFEFEIPEISNGSIEIKSVAREAGSRSKISVKALQDNIDPIGSCVGQRGTRVQTIISELAGEKVDIIEYSDDPVTYISNALAPAKVEDITIDEENMTSVVTVAEDQLSLAIGKAGQNVRLAAKLTGWKINIKGEKAIDSKNEEPDNPKSPDESNKQ